LNVVIQTIIQGKILMLYNFFTNKFMLKKRRKLSQNFSSIQRKKEMVKHCKSKPRKILLVRQLLIFFMALILVILGNFTQLHFGQGSSAVAAVSVQLPLSTRRAKIVDAKGKPVLLRGVNWFGMETEIHSPHGLWKRDYKEMLLQMKSLGYNVIRLPFSLQALRSTNILGVDFRIGANKELEGKQPIEVMDLVIQEAERQGLLVLLDCHRLSDKQIGELWYGDGFTEQDWLDTWKMLAERYKNQVNVIGADLKNEPHGKASWGTGDLATDWRLAAERAGKEILAVAPNWLIVVEGTDGNVPGQRLKRHWWGGNLEGVKRFPVRLPIRNRVVYSPHEYGPGVSNMPWFSDRAFPKNLRPRWEIGFNYIARQNIAPVLIGEFGGRQVDTKSIEGIWQNELVKFIRENRLHFAYWSWNPNSADTGGVLLDDWYSFDVPKQKLLSRLSPIQFNSELVARWTKPPEVAQAPPANQPNQPSQYNQQNPNQQNPNQQNQQATTGNAAQNPPTSAKPFSAQLEVNSNIYSDWPKGFCVSFKVKNPGGGKVSNWQLTFNMADAEINNSWNAAFSKQGTNQYIVTPADWGKAIEPNQMRDIGFCANKRGSNFQPTQVEAKGEK
jgi:endoglucanase